MLVCLNFVSITILVNAVASVVISNSSKEVLAPSTEKVTIVGGHNASITDHPYQVSLSYHEKFVCGGSIISANFILTADHCSYWFREADGIIARSGCTSRLNGTIIPIAEIIFHPNRGINLDLDVLLLKTAKRIKFTDVIRPIKLPVEDEPLKDNSEVTVSGWGATSENDGVLSTQLLAVKIPVVNFYDCWKIYGEELTRNMWCAGDLKTGGKGPCAGDSGGPAVQGDVLYGIVSWSHGCAHSGYPTVFTDIAAPAIREFIGNHTGL